jgi:predicted XRE-type DNA-binding protein
VWDALEETPGAAENMRIRSALMQELVAYINRSGMTQAQVARKFGHPAPHLRSHPGQDRPLQHRRLVNMLTAAGLHLDLRIREAS